VREPVILQLAVQIAEGGIAGVGQEQRRVVAVSSVRKVCMKTDDARAATKSASARDSVQNPRALRSAPRCDPFSPRWAAAETGGVDWGFLDVSLRERRRLGRIQRGRYILALVGSNEH
jgi:hypothetical protein